MIADILGIAAVTGGAFFLLVGSIGLIRLPDFYTRNHATGKSDTLGIMLVLFGLILIEGVSLNSAKLLIANYFGDLRENLDLFLRQRFAEAIIFCCLTIQ